MLEDYGIMRKKYANNFLEFFAKEKLEIVLSVPVPTLPKNGSEKANRQRT